MGLFYIKHQEVLVIGDEEVSWHPVFRQQYDKEHKEYYERPNLARGGRVDK